MIHREGFKEIFFTTLLLTILNIGVYFLIPEQAIVQKVIIVISLVFYVLIIQFFRNPPRNTDREPLHIIAPADGKVVVIEEVDEPEYLKTKCRQVSIFMSPLNVHVNRNPMDGTVEYFKYHKGKFLVAWHPKSSTENERTTMVLRSPTGTKVLIRQIAGAVAKRIRWYVKEGQDVNQGSEYGFIKFGSRVDLFLPLDAEIKVNIDDKTRGGESVIAVLKG